MTEPSLLSRWGEPSLAHLVVPIVLYMSMVFSSYTNMTNLIIDLSRRRICGSAADDACGDDDDAEASVSAAAAQTSSYVFLAESVFAILVVGHLGNLSDRIGRRPIAALSLLGNLLECLAVVAIIYYELPVWTLCVATAVQGICGSYCGFLMAASAYVADLNNRLLQPHHLTAARTERFSKFEVLLNIGAVAGPVLGGWSVTRYGYTPYFLTCALLSAALLFYVAAMPEALQRRRQAAQHHGAPALLAGGEDQEEHYQQQQQQQRREHWQSQNDSDGLDDGGAQDDTRWSSSSSSSTQRSSDEEDGIVVAGEEESAAGNRLKRRRRTTTTTMARSRGGGDPSSFLEKSTLGAVRLLWQTRSCSLAEDDTDADGATVAVAGVVVCGSYNQRSRSRSSGGRSSGSSGSSDSSGGSNGSSSNGSGSSGGSIGEERGSRRAAAIGGGAYVVESPLAPAATATAVAPVGKEPLAEPLLAASHGEERGQRVPRAVASVVVDAPATAIPHSPPQRQRPRCSPGLVSRTTEAAAAATNYHRDPKVRSRLRLSLVSVAFFLTYGNTVSASGLYVLYTRYAWGWGQYTVGIFLSSASVLGVVALLSFRRVFCFLSGGRPPSDILMGQLGALASGIYFSLFASLQSPLAAFCLLPLMSIQTAATPSYRSLYSASFGPDQQGQIFAAVSALEAVPGLVTPLVFDMIYSVTVTRGLASIAFFALSIAATAAALALCFVRVQPSDDRIEEGGHPPPQQRAEGGAGEEEAERQLYRPPLTPPPPPPPPPLSHAACAGLS